MTFSGIGAFLLAILIGVTGWQAYKTFDSHNWPSVTARVVGTEVYMTHGGRHNSTYYHVRIHYLYIVNHASYVEEASFETFTTPMEAERWMNKQYWKGQHLTILYNPANPSINSFHRSLL